MAKFPRCFPRRTDTTHAAQEGKLGKSLIERENIAIIEQQKAPVIGMISDSRGEQDDGNRMLLMFRSAVNS